jgi:EEF1A lysine methyltransferase 4
LLNPLHFATANGTTASLKGRGGPLLPKASSSFPAREHSRVLILGCGNSSFGADMLRDGWGGRIMCVDFSQVVIDQMKSKYSKHFYDHLPQPHGHMEFLCADVTKPLDFAADGSFDLVICKATMDVVLCSTGSKNAALAMVQESARVLCPHHGIFFLVTNGNSDNRLEYLERQNDLTFYWHGVGIHRVEPKHHK